MNAQCVICTAPLPDQAYACSRCAGRIGRDLAEVADLAGPARAVAAGQTRRGTAAVSGATQGRLPLNLAAAARVDAATNAVTTWARHVASERGVEVPSVHAGGRTGWSEGDRVAQGVSGDLSAAARWLVGHLEWLRHRVEVDEVARDVAAAVRVLRGVVDGPSPRRWLGQCGAIGHDGPCRLDLGARPGATTARCRCGASVVVADRLAELAELVRGYSYTAAEISEAYPEIRANTIRVWASRGRLLPTGEIDGRPVYDLGEVLDRARSELLRRAERQARRSVVDHAGAQGVTSHCSATTVPIAGSAA